MNNPRRIMKSVDGRDAITRKEWADQIGYTDAGARALYAKRTENGHPEAAFVIGRTSYWWKDELTKWWDKRQRETRPAPIARTGNPDDLLTAQQASDLLGYSSGRTVIGMAARDQFPKPDDHLPGAGQKSGQDRPLWKRSSVWNYADGRTTIRK
jgi:hypothetical protein